VRVRVCVLFFCEQSVSIHFTPPKRYAKIIHKLVAKFSHNNLIF
jgi:hypothetical protein